MRSEPLSRFLRPSAWVPLTMLAVAQVVLAATAPPSIQPTPPVVSDQSQTGNLPGPSGSATSLPGNATVLTPEAQGDLAMAHGKYVAAIQAYQHSPVRSAVICNKIGIAYHHLFALEEARKNYQMALALDPKYAAALNNLAAVYQGEHNYSRAERSYKKALKYDSGSAVTYRNLGTSYFASGNYKQGTKAYQKALKLDPQVFSHSDTQAIDEGSSARQRMAISYYLAKTYAMAGENERALDYLRRALGEGFNDRRHLMEDKEFSRLRATPEFQRLIVQQHLD